MPYLQVFPFLQNELPLQDSVPPVMAFHLGSLGFLTPFKFESYKTEVAKVFEGRISLFFKMGCTDL